MKYKFIGTEQDLIDNGFETEVSFSGYDYDEKIYLGRDNQKMNGVEVRIDFKTSIIDNNYIYGRKIMKSDIQDLIDKGLVVEE